MTTKISKNRSQILVPMISLVFVIIFVDKTDKKTTHGHVVCIICDNCLLAALHSENDFKS